MMKITGLSNFFKWEYVTSGAGAENRGNGARPVE